MNFKYHVKQNNISNKKENHLYKHIKPKRIYYYKQLR